MKKSLVTCLFLLASVVLTSAQREGAGAAPPPERSATRSEFPGISQPLLNKLKYAKTRLLFPLPTWLPAGFAMDKIEMKLGSEVAIADKVFVVVYAKSMGRGKYQKFAIETGFDGLGDLPYETSIVKSPVGEIGLAYQPIDPDTGKRWPGYSRTAWFDIGGKFAYAYDGMYGDEEVVMMSRSDTIKIIQSLKKY